MTAATFVLQRTVDHSGVSGTGVVAHGVEWEDGSVAVHWPGDHPSTSTWADIRDVEAIHGHRGATTVQFCDSDRLVRAYRRVMPHLLGPGRRPTACAPHPDHPGALRLVFIDETAWRFWLALLDGSSHAAVHEAVNGEIEHRWVSPDGLLWLSYCTLQPGASTTNDLESDR